MVVTTTRGLVPWDSGGSSVSRECWAVWTRASHIRAPWSRGSRSVSQVGSSGSTAGCGFGQREQGGADDLAVLGGSVALDPDAAGAVADHGQEPLQVRGAFLAVQGASAARSSPSGSTTAAMCRPARTRSVAVSVADWCTSNFLGLGTQGGVAGQGVDGVDDDPGLGQRRGARHAPPPEVAVQSEVIARASRTRRRPSRRKPPVRWVNQSAVEAHWSRFLGSSRTSTSASIGAPARRPHRAAAGPRHALEQLVVRPPRRQPVRDLGQPRAPQQVRCQEPVIAMTPRPPTPDRGRPTSRRSLWTESGPRAVDVPGGVLQNLR